MNIWKKLLAVAAVAVMASAVFYVGIQGDRIIGNGEIPDNALIHKPTVNIWYTDETLSDFLASAALEFSEGRDVRVIPRLVSGLEYLETINRESLNSSSTPDMYIIGNDSLEKAYLAGLACEVQDEGYVSEENFPETALHAVTYNDKQIAYPFYYETSALIYNKTYLEEHVKTVLEAEADAQAGEEAMEALDEDGQPEESSTDGTDGSTADSDADDSDGTADSVDEAAAVDAETQAAVDERMTVVIPTSVDDILSFADSYEAPEQVQAVFKWDVTDIFYNYFFVGNYVSVGGPNGDKTDQIDIYNLDAIRCLQSYQQMSEFFSIEAEEVDYNSVVTEFLEGKLVFTVATSDVIARIAEAQKNGEFPYEYGVTNVPDIDSELTTRSMSETHVVVINGYSDKKEDANDFAEFLTGKAAENLYDRAGKFSANANVTHASEQVAAFFDEYAASVPVPKMMATSNYWVQAEVAFTKIWAGDDVSMTLKNLSEQIMTQVTGTEYVEEYIEAPVEEETVIDN